MTWKETNLILQWGSCTSGLSSRIHEVSYYQHKHQAQWVLTFHYPSGSPTWVPVKGEHFVVSYFSSQRVVPREQRVLNYSRGSRWVTRGILLPVGTLDHYVSSGYPRWGIASGFNSQVLGKISLYGLLDNPGSLPSGAWKSTMYDYTGWRLPLRGNLKFKNSQKVSKWGVLSLFGENHLIRPKYV